MGGGAAPNLRSSFGPPARARSWFGGADFLSPSSAALKIALWVDAIGCAHVAKWTLLGTGGIHLYASARAVRSSVQNRHWAGTMHWRYG